MTSFLRAAAVLLFGVLVSTASFGGTNVWTTGGPPGGLARQVHESRTSTNVFYSAYARTLYRSTDGGIAWHAFREFDSRITRIAIDPTDGDRIYLAVYDDGIYRSDDGGETFNLIAPVTDGIWTVVANGPTVYYSTNAQTFFRSTDHGQTWAARQPTPMRVSKVLIDADDANVVYAWSSPSPDVLKSMDGGGSWTAVAPSTPSPILDMARLSSTRLIASAANGIHFSSDSGATWTASGSGSGGTSTLTAVPSVPGRAIATNRENVFTTDDFGVTWTAPIQTSLGAITSLAVDAQVPTRLVAVSDQGALRSADGGLTWTEATQQPIASAPLEIVTTAASNSKVYAFTSGSDGGLFSTSGDSGWQRLNLQAATAAGARFFGSTVRIALRPGAPNAVYASSTAHWPVNSEDGGNSWAMANPLIINFDVAALAFDVDDTNVIYAQTAFGNMNPASGLYRSPDGGATWTPYGNLSFLIKSKELQIDPADGTRMFISVLRGNLPTAAGLWRSIDRGLTWSQIAFAGQDVRNVAFDPATPARVYAAAQGGLQESSNGGDSFAANGSFAVTTANRAAASIAIDPSVPTTIYATSVADATASGQGLTSSSHVLRSVDRGQTWEILRDAAATPRWSATHLILDPNDPTLVYVNTGGHGVATLRIAPDLAVEIDGHSGVRPQDEEATFNLRASNNGPYAATEVRLTANLPAGLANVSATSDRGSCTVAAVITCNVSVLGAGEAVSVVVRYTPTTTMSIPVTASVAAHESDVATGNNSADATALTEDDVANLRVTIQSSAASVIRGGNFTYSVIVTNGGPATAAAGTLAFTPGAGVTLGALPNGCSNSGAAVACSLSSMAANASQSFAFPATATQAGSLTATANVEVAASIVESDVTDNTATAAITVSEPAPSGGGSSSGGGGGGGGAFNLGMLLALLSVRMFRRCKLARPWE